MAYALAVSPPLLLSASSDGDLDERTPALLAAIRPWADIIDARPYSGLLIALTLELAPDKLPNLARALSEAGAPLDELPTPGAGPAPEVVALLSIRFRGGDPDQRREVPDVPG